MVESGFNFQNEVRSVYENMIKFGSGFKIMSDPVFKIKSDPVSILKIRSDPDPEP